jgi:hypothetical protein
VILVINDNSYKLDFIEFYTKIFSICNAWYHFMDSRMNAIMIKTCIKIIKLKIKYDMIKKKKVKRTSRHEDCDK